MSTEPGEPADPQGIGASDPVPVPEPKEKRSGLGIAGFALSALAGFLLAVGSLLVWAEFRIGQGAGAYAFPLHGTDTTEGKIALVAGLAVVVGALLLRIGKTENGRPVAGVIIVIAALVGAGTTGYFAMNAESKYQDKPIVEIAQKLANESGLPAAAAAQHEKEMIAAGKALETFSLGIGVWIALAAAIASLVGGVLAFVWARRTRHDDASAPPKGDLQIG
jgi:disulfide bond formation protein DsbB